MSLFSAVVAVFLFYLSCYNEAIKSLKSSKICFSKKKKKYETVRLSGNGLCRFFKAITCFIYVGSIVNLRKSHFKQFVSVHSVSKILSVIHSQPPFLFLLV